MSELIITGTSPFARWWQRSRFIGMLWLLMLPSLAGLLLFTYYPNIESVFMSMHRWSGGEEKEFIAASNYRKVFTQDPLFWQSFGLIGILLCANLLKMWPSIFAAIILHRLKSDRSQFIYRVFFVIPMVIPALVGLLIWKSFFDPTVGVLNKFLTLTGLMPVLGWMDTAAPTLSQTLTHAASPLTWGIQPVFGSLFGLILFGVVLLMLRGGFAKIMHLWMVWVVLLGFGVLAWGRVGSGGGVVEAVLRGSFLLGAAAALVSRLRRADPLEGGDRIAFIGWMVIIAGAVLVLLTKVWPAPTGAFATGQPAWLGHSKLVIPAVILWGFPWIGTVGVLIYLAGLQNISKEVYEAADLDGVGFWGKIFRIEVPLILTQIRINLIFLTIGTLNEYAFFLILLGPSGGPDNAGLTPGLYMYQQAFIGSQFGYACALGMVMFSLILFLTIIYQRHLKVAH
jgi:ABC-type sugar transport system permease subunit